MAQSYPAYYNDMPRSHHPNVLPIPAPRPRNRSKQRWPPPPSVEDEVVSLSREHTPVLPDLIGGEAQSRGSVDQLPIILDADLHATFSQKIQTAGRSRNHNYSLTSRSSTESFGPQTPPESATCSSERRYTWKPKPDVEIPQRYDEPVAKTTTNKSYKGLEPVDRHAQKEPSSSPARPGRVATETKAPPLKLSRDSSPYAYSANSGKSTFSGDYLMSPDTLSPDSRYPNTKRDSTPRRASDMYGATTHDSRHRTMSNSAPRPGRPTFDRHVTAVGYSGEQLLGRSPLRPSRTAELSSDDSDLSYDENSSLRNERRGTRYSVARPESTRHASSLRYDEAVQQSRKSQLPVSKPPPLPSRPQSATWDRGPYAQPQPYGSSVPSSAPISTKSTLNRISLPPRASPRASPSTSPYSTPPASPDPDSQRYSYDSPPSGRKSRPGSRPSSRPSSPISSARIHARSGGLELPDDFHFSHRSSYTPKSRQTSPLPSPEPEYPSSSSGIRIGVQEASPARSYKSTIQSTEIPTRPKSRDISVPFILSNPPQQQPIGVPHTRRALSSADNRSRPDVEPIRRASEMPLSPPYLPATRSPAHSKLPITLPICPRPEFVAGYHDWSTLPGAPHFDVCPTCRTAIEQAGFVGQFQPSPSRPPGYETRCDLSITWIRMTWLLVLQNKARPNLVHEMMEVVAQEHKCPGKNGAVRNWYRLYDPEANRPITNFNACSYCVRSVETLFPNLHGTFHLVRTDVPQKRTCDLRTESARFPKYLDMLEEISNQAWEYRRPPNLFRFVQLAKKLANLRECNRDDMLLDHVWHYIPHLPEFTVCEECYEDVVWPAIASGSELADQFHGTLQLLPPPFNRGGVSCQLYSARMRAVFRESCAANDYLMLKKEAVKRWEVERDLQGRLKLARDGGEIAALVEEWKNWE